MHNAEREISHFLPVYIPGARGGQEQDILSEKAASISKTKSSPDELPLPEFPLQLEIQLIFSKKQMANLGEVGLSLNQLPTCVSHSSLL